MSQLQVEAFNRRFREHVTVDLLWDKKTGRTTREVLTGRAFVWKQSGEAVAWLRGVGLVLCEAIHMPAGWGG